MPDPHDVRDPDAWRRTLNAMIEKGLEDIRQGRIVTADEIERRVATLLTERAARRKT